MSVPLFNPEVLDPTAALLTHFMEADDRPLDPNLIGDLVREMRSVSGAAGELALCAFAELALDTVAKCTNGTKEQIWRMVLGSVRTVMAEKTGQ